MRAILFLMEETLVNKMFESFDTLDENELMLILNQVGRRMLVLRCETPDASFWYGVLMRVSKWLSTEPIVQLHACKEIVDAWIRDNLGLVHDAVKESFLASEKNRKEKEANP